ncbi:TPA_asm: UL37 uoORF *1 [Human alphaherpesvirus 1]|nr:TPA_asm: UL37 uoORF *1 [Human alphaherpesvirus 1]
MPGLKWPYNTPRRRGVLATPAGVLEGRGGSIIRRSLQRTTVIPARSRRWSTLSPTHASRASWQTAVSRPRPPSSRPHPPVRPRTDLCSAYWRA